MWIDRRSARGCAVVITFLLWCFCAIDKIMRAICLFLLLFMSFGTRGQLCFASSVQEMRMTLETGRYDLVVEQGSALGSADGYILAAEALNTKLLLGKAKRKTKTAKRAMKLAKAALEMDPRNAEAQIQYALAYGFYGRHASNFKAWRKKLPQKIHAEILTAAVMKPGEARVEALLGAWHLNMHYRASGFDVEKRYGASTLKGAAHFDNALEMVQGFDIIIASNYLMLQFVLDPETRSDQTKLVLQTNILTQKPTNAVESQILGQMQYVYEGFNKGSALERAEAFLDQ